MWKGSLDGSFWFCTPEQHDLIISPAWINIVIPNFAEHMTTYPRLFQWNSGNNACEVLYRMLPVYEYILTMLKIITWRWKKAFFWIAFALAHQRNANYNTVRTQIKTLQWRQNGPDGVSDHQPHVCLLIRLFRRRSKKTSKLRVTGLCVGNSPVTGEFPAQMASNAEKIQFDDIIMSWCNGCVLT